MLVCFGPGRAGLGLECVGPGRASGLSTSGRAGPRAWIEDFGPGSGLEFRPVATSNVGITMSYIYTIIYVGITMSYIYTVRCWDHYELHLHN